MKQGDLIHGFAVRTVKELPEQKAVLYQMEYVFRLLKAYRSGLIHERG